MINPLVEEQLQLIEDCENHEERMTDWERRFISSIKGQLENDKNLSDKQIESLDAIWERVTEKD